MVLSLLLVVVGWLRRPSARPRPRPVIASAKAELPWADCWREDAFRFMSDDRPWAAVEERLRDAVGGTGLLPGDTAPAIVGPLPEAAELPPNARERSTWAVRLAYYGPAFGGFAWQRDQPTVASRLDECLLPLLDGKHNLRIASAGRTDAGVSAVGQLITFYSWPRLDERRIADAINGAAGELRGERADELRVLSAVRVPRSFHATFSATWRRYAYFLPTRLGGDDVSAAAVDAQLRELSGAERDYAALGRVRFPCPSLCVSVCVGLSLSRANARAVVGSRAAAASARFRLRAAHVGRPHGHTALTCAWRARARASCHRGCPAARTLAAPCTWPGRVR